jgi:hypothetical protein
MGDVKMKDLLKKTYDKMNFFSRDWFIALWKGERPLWEAWFVLGLSVYIVGYVLIYTLVGQLYPGLSTALYFVYLFMQALFWITAWRCAQNAINVYLYLSRGLILLAVFSTLGQLLR